MKGYYKPELYSSVKSTLFASTNHQAEGSYLYFRREPASNAVIMLESNYQDMIRDDPVFFAAVHAAATHI